MSARNDVWAHRQKHSIYSVAISGNGEYISTGSKDGTINCFDRQGKLLWNYSTKGQIGAVSLSSDGRYIVAGSADKNAYCFRWMDKLLGKYGIGEPVLAVSISGDGKYIMIGSADGGLFWIERESGKLLWRYRLTAPVFGVSLAENGKFASACSVNSVLCFTSGKLDWKFDAGGHILGLAMSSNGKYVCITAEDNFLYFLDRGTGQVMWKYKSESPIWGVAISSSGEYVVHGSDDGFVHCFNGITGKTLWKYNAKTKIYGVSISAKGTYIVASSIDENIFCFENYLVTSKFALKHTHDLLEDAEALGIEVGEIKAIIKDAEEAFAAKDYSRVFKQCKNADDALVALIEMKKTEIPVAKPVIEVLETEESKKMRNWVITLGVIDRSVKFDPEITNALIPLYNKHEELLHDSTIEDRINDYTSKIEMFENILKNYERISKLNPAASEGIMKVGDEVKAGITALKNTVDQLKELQHEKEKTIVELEDQVRLLVVDWLTGVSRLAATGEVLKATEKREREITQMVEEIINETMTKFKVQPGVKANETNVKSDECVTKPVENKVQTTPLKAENGKSRLSSWIEPSDMKGKKLPENLEKSDIDEPAPVGDEEPAVIEPSTMKPVTEYKPAKLPEKIEAGVEEILTEMKSEIEQPNIESSKPKDVSVSESGKIAEVATKEGEVKQPSEMEIQSAKPVDTSKADEGPIFVIADEEEHKEDFELLDEDGNVVDKDTLEKLIQGGETENEAVFEEIKEESKDESKDENKGDPEIEKKETDAEKGKVKDKGEKRKGRRGRKSKKGKEEERLKEEKREEVKTKEEEKETKINEKDEEKREKEEDKEKVLVKDDKLSEEKIVDKKVLDVPKEELQNLQKKERKRQSGPDLEFD